MTARALAALLLLAAAPAVAQSDAEALAALPEAGNRRIVDITGGTTFRLEDGTEIRLDGILAPELPREAEAARSRLDAIARGRAVTLRGADPAPDRWNRRILEVVRDDGLWLEAELLDAGLARVETRAGHAELAPQLLAHEAAARRERRGLWAERAFAVHSPADATKRGGVFEIVEGRIATTQPHGTAIWLEFGQSQTQIAARIEHRALASFVHAGLDPAHLAGTTLRLRGWTFWQGRTVIELDHPEAVERIEPAE